MSILELCGIIFIAVIIINVVIGFRAMKSAASNSEEEFNMVVDQEEEIHN